MRPPLISSTVASGLALTCLLLSGCASEKALQTQKRNHLLLGMALIQTGALDEATLERLHAEFKLDQAPYQTAALELPSAVPGPDAAMAFVDLSRKLLQRVARLQTKFDGPVTLSQQGFEAQTIASQRVEGAKPFTCWLGVNSGVAHVLTEGLLGFAPDKPTHEDDQETTRDFLHVVSVNVATKLTQSGSRYLAQPAAVQSVAPAARALTCRLHAAGDHIDGEVITLAITWD